MLNLFISPENTFGSFMLVTCVAILATACAYCIFYKKNFRIVFDRIVSSGKFRSSISLIAILISTIFFISWFLIKSANVSSNELLQYDETENTITISAEPTPNDSVTYKVQFANEPSKHQKEEIAKLINQWYQSKSTNSSEIASSSINDNVSSGKHPLTVEFSASANADSIYIKESIFAQIDSVVAAQPNPGLLWSTLYHIIDPGNQHMAKTPFARILALLLSLFGTVFITGLFISVLTNIFDSRRERWAKGMLRYNWLFSNHYVIIGCNEMVPNIINQIFADYRKNHNTRKSKHFDERLPYILILTSSDVEAQRDILFPQLDKNEQKRIVFYYGNRGSAEDVKSLRLHAAKEAYVLGESVDKDRIGQTTNNGEPHHDTLNLTCVKLMAKALETAQEPSSQNSNWVKVANFVWTITKVVGKLLAKLLVFIISLLNKGFKSLGKLIGSLNGTKMGKTFNSLKISKEKLLRSIIDTDDDEDLKDRDFEDIQLEGYKRPMPKKDAQQPVTVAVTPSIANSTMPKAETPQQTSADKKNNKDIKPARLICHVLFEYQTTFSIFQSANLDPNISKVIDFRPFNYYESWAQKVFVENEATLSFNDDKKDKPIKYKPLDNNGLTEQSDEHVHLIVVGMSKMGVALALEAAHICHFPNFIEKGIRTRITFIDSQASQEMNFFKGRFKDMFEIARWRYIKADDYTIPGLFNKTRDEIYNETATWRDPLKDSASESAYKHLAINGESFLDIEWEFIEGSLECPSVQHYLTLAAQDNNSLLTVAICLPQAHQATAAGIYMPREVYINAQQVLIYQRESAEIVNTMDNEKIRPFGMLECCYNLANDDKAFRQAKLVNFVYCTYNNDKEKAKIHEEEKIDIITDKAEEFWAKCTVEDIWSNFYSANSFPSKLRAYDIATADYTTMGNTIDSSITSFATVEHNRWNVEKLLTGFRPLTKDESDTLESLLKRAAYTCESHLNRSEWKNKRNALKARPHKAHVNIRPFDMLKHTDPYVYLADHAISQAIPYILKYTTSTPNKK